MKNHDQKKSGIIISYLIMGLNIIIGLVYIPFLLSKIGKSEYGIYSLSSSLISFITILDLGLGQTLVRYISKYKALGEEDKEAKINGFFISTYSAIAVLGLLIGIVVTFIYPIICRNAMTDYEIYIFRIVFLLLLINTIISFPMSVFTAILNAYEEFFYLKFVNFAVIILKYISFVFLLIAGYKIIAITITTVVFSIGMQLLYVAFCFFKLKIKFSFGNYDMTIVKEIVAFSFFIFLNLIVDFLYNNTDKIILGAIKGTMEVSIYSMGIYFMTYFQELSTAMSGVFMPQITKIYEETQNLSRLSDIFLKIGRLQLTLLSVVLGGYILFGKEFIILWLGEEFINSYYIGLIIMIPAIIPLTQNIGISILRAMNMHRYRSYMYLVIAVINVVISIPLARKWSGVGSAIGTSIATLMGQIIFMNWFYKKVVNIDIKTYWLNLTQFLLPNLLFITVGFYIKNVWGILSWNRLIVYMCVYVLVIFVWDWIFVFNKYEKEMVKKIIKNKSKDLVRDN